MPDREGRLYLFEALLLRDEYDRRIALLQKLLDPERDRRSGLPFGASEHEEFAPAVGFQPQATEAELKKLKTRRLKLNQEIQIANFRATVTFEGEEVLLGGLIDSGDLDKERARLTKLCEQFRSNNIEIFYKFVVFCK